MKKKYAKPEIIFESFSMNASIAGDCEVKTMNPAPEQCGLVLNTFPPLVIFTSDLPKICNAYPSPGQYDQLCYHIPYESYNLFNS